MASALLTAEAICKRALQELGEDVDITSISSPTSAQEAACNIVYAAARDELQQEYQWSFTRARAKVERNSNSRHTLLKSTGGWTVSAVATEYYLPISDTKSFKSKPDFVYEDDTAMTEGTLGSLTAGKWAWGDNDSLGESTIYVRLSDSTDPDTKYAADNDYLEAVYNDPVFGWNYALPYPADTLSVWNLGQNSFSRQYWSISTGTATSYVGPQEQTWEIENYRILADDATIYLIYGHKITDPAKFDKWYTEALIYYIAMKLAIKLTNSQSLRNDMAALFESAIKTGRRNNALQSNVRREKTLTTHRPTTAWAGRGR